jgi:threonine aldolase
MTKRSFASDNNAGVHPEVIEAIRAVNDGHVIAYGDDDVTARAVKLLK